MGQEKLNLTRTILFAVLILVLIAIPQMPASADIGPKPSFYFKFDFNRLTSQPENYEVILYQCLDQDCGERELLPEVPGQYWECDQEGCSVELLTGRDVWQVDLQLGESTLSSQPFEKEGFYSVYSLIVDEQSLRVEFVSSSEPALSATAEDGSSGSRNTRWAEMVMSVFLTVLVELPLAAVLLLLFKARFKNMLWIVLGNLVSLPAVWFLVPLLPVNPIMLMVFILLTSSVIEAVILGILGGDKISWIKAAAISLLINVASFAAGLSVTRY